ncbi:MAG: 2'-5' RNA ligase family protein [Patescibacteria group bacterium]|nr:2'-5' RNA ligase family protein [Patescibacteria group bacterium]
MATMFTDWSAPAKGGQVQPTAQPQVSPAAGRGTGMFHDWATPTPAPAAKPTVTPTAPNPASPTQPSAVNGFENFMGNLAQGAEKIAGNVGKAIVGEFTPQNQNIPATGKTTPTVLPGGLKVDFVTPTAQADQSAQTPFSVKSQNQQPTQQQPLAPGQSELKPYTPTLWDKIGQIFNNFTGYDQTTQKALAMNAYALKKVAPEATKNYSLSQLAEPGGNPVKNSSQETVTQQIGVRSEPSTSEFTNMLMTAAAGLGLVEAPIAAVKALGIFSGVSALKSGLVSALTGHGFNPLSGATASDIVPNAPPQLKTALDVLDFLGTAAVTHGIFTHAPGAFDALTKETLTKYNLPQTFTIDPATLRDIQTGGKVTPQDVQDAFTKLQLTGEERAAIAKGKSIDITIPASQVTAIVDRPYWAKIKSIFRIAPSDPTLTGEGTGQPTVSDHISGLLPPGEYKPETVRSTLLNTPFKDTPEVKAVIDASLKANEQGKNLQFSKVSETVPTTRPAFTSNVAQASQQATTEKLNEIRQSSNSQDEAVQKLNEAFVQGLETVKGNREALAGLRTALAKEAQGIAGHSGNYKGDYAMMQALKDSPDIGKYMTALENHIVTADNMLFASDKENIQTLEALKKEIAALPASPEKTQLDTIITEITSKEPFTGEAQYALDVLTNTDNFAEFTKSVGDLAKEFDSEFTSLHNDITSGKITESDYERFSKQYRESLQTSTQPGSAISSEPVKQNLGAGNESTQTENNGAKPQSTKGSELNAETNGSEHTRAGERNGESLSNETNRAAGNGTSITPHYDYQSTQIDLPAEEAKKITDFASKIPDDALYIDQKESIPGRETDPHVTVLYGLDNKVTKEDVAAAVGDTAPITVKFGKTSLFTTNPKYDVLKVDVESQQLRSLNSKIDQSLPHPGTTFPEYQPHATIAYLKKGMGEKYANNGVFEGDEVKLPDLTFSKNDGTKITIPLKGNEEYVTTPLSRTSFKDTQLADYMPNKEAGFIDPGAILDSVTETIDAYKKSQSDNRFGEALRAYFVGERDVRVAETNQLVEDFAKKVKLPVQQEALTLMRDFKGREPELQMLLDGLHPYYDRAVEQFKKENPDATPKEIEDFATSLLERGKKLQNVIKWAQNPTEEMKAVDQQMTDYFAKKLEEGQKLGFLDSKIKPEEYINHLLTPKEEVKPSRGMFASKNKIGRYFQFAKGRAYKDVVEAYLNGSDPKTLNALDAMSIYGDKHSTVAATHLLIKQLKTTELGKFGSRKSEYIPADWEEVAPESNLFKNEIPFIKEFKKEGMTPEQIASWEKKVTEGRAKSTEDKYLEADIAHQSLFAPKKVVDALKPITGGDYLNNLPGFAKMRLYQAYIKTAELGLSVFHMRAMTLTSMGNQDIIGTLRSAARDINTPQFKEIERNFIKAGGTTSILGRTIEAYRATRKPSVEGFLLKETPVIHQLDQIAHGLTHTTFNVLQRKYKVIDFALKDAAWMSKHMNATDAEHYIAQRSIAKEINAAYGGLQWEILGVGKMLQNLTRFLMLAPDWTFSNWFNAKTAFEGGAGGKAARAFWVRSIIYGVILNQIASVLFSGQLSQNPAKAHLGKDGQGKSVDVNLGFAGAPSDMLNLISNIALYGVVQGFFTSLSAKESPTLRTLSQFLSNRNYLGQTIIPKGAGVVVGTARSAVELAQGMSPVPFSIQNYFNMLTDTKGKYIPAEYLTILLGGGTPSHTVPNGMRQVTSGARKGQLVPASAPAPQRPLLEQIMTGKMNEPKVRSSSGGHARGGFHVSRHR